jgi:hypothetical protein
LSKIVRPEGLFYEARHGHDGMSTSATHHPQPRDEGRHYLKHDLATGKTTVYRSPSGMSNGIAFDAQRRMIVAHQGDYGLPHITRTDMATGKAEIVAPNCGSHPFHAPNDVIVDSKGRIFFTDPMYDHRSWSRKSNRCAASIGSIRMGRSIWSAIVHNPTATPFPTSPRSTFGSFGTGHSWSRTT